ncbi:MAG: cation:proton antiporter [Sedimentisphaerales bacterium]|nr:cation:proton antiporter [Sedimentisphaerales bacterium]
MMEIFKQFITLQQGFNFLLMIGIAVFGGTVGAKMFQRFRIPQVVGYVAIGLVLGPLLKIIPPDAIKSLEPFNIFAIGTIGFLVGGELKREIFVKFGKQVPIILFFEGVTAFVLVGVLSFFVMRRFDNWQMALAVAVVFGAICSATDPASTIAVLWEYKARGPLTAMITAIVTLDDALALFLYALSISVAGVITGHQEVGLLSALAGVLYEILGALAVGGVAGLGMAWLVKRVENADKMLHIMVSSVMIVIGLAMGLKVDVILACMAFGVVLVNTKSRKVEMSFDVVHRFFTPMYVLFFVLVGARVNISYMDKKIFWLVIAYVGGSITGKTLGSYVGGRLSGAVKSIRRYLGFCLYPQGTIVIGLLIIASNKFESDVSSIMLLVVVVGAFLLQLIGPIGVKYGAGRAGELGLNVTEQDLIKTCRVREVMDTEAPAIAAGASLAEVIGVFSSTSNSHYSVVDADKKLIGVINLAGLRNTFATRGLNDWLIALDLAEPAAAKATPEVRLSEALESMQMHGIDFIPVTVSAEDDSYVGAIESAAVHRRISAQVLARQREADSKFGLGPQES